MMRSRILLSTYILLSLYLPSKASWNKHIYVSPSGNDSQSCGNANQPCKSLDEAFAIALNGSGGANSTLISVAKGNYTLTKTFNFTNVNTFALIGEKKSNEVRIRCEPNVSLSFILCQNIAFQGFMLHGCGGWRESTVGANKSAHAGQSHQGVKFKTALDFRYCRDAQFTNIEISSSPGLGVNLYDVGGVVNFTDCVLADNKALSVNKSSNGSLQGFIEEGFVYSGGGIYMILNQYGDNVVNVTPSEHDSFQHNNTYIFRNCHFLGNEAFGWNLSHKHDIIDDPGPYQFSLGGGLAINFRGNASNCNTTLESCVFLGNHAVWGGGLQVETRIEVKNNHFTIQNTSFKDNTGLLAGGGVRMGNLLQRGASDPLNTFTFDNCSFVNNSAIWGGGMSLYGTPVLCRLNCAKRKTQFIFNRSNWSRNDGTVGAALATMLAKQNEVQIGPEMPYSISFKDCLFSSNQVVKLDKGIIIGEGALFSDQVPLIFQGTASLRNNTNTALSLDGSTVEIFGKMNFTNNKGYRGGAVAMRGLSRIIFQKHSELTFYNNSCDNKGGALYFESAGSPAVDFNATGVNTHECFFGYTDEKVDFNNWETTVIFEGNRAVDDGKGKSVYATTLRYCRRPGESRQNNTVLKWKIIQFKTLDGKVTSRDSEVATDAIDMNYERDDWVVAPGEAFNATVKLIDEIGNSVVGIVDVDINFPENSSPVKLDTTSSLFLTGGHISHLRLAGKPGSLFTVSLRYVGRQVLVDAIPDIKMRSCHEGFKSDKSSCVCMDSLDEGVARCDSDGRTVYLKQGYWGGKVDGKFVTHRCPADYCNFTDTVIPGEYQYFSGHVCKGDRDQNSILCGACKPGSTILFGNEHCSSSCSNWWLFMIIPDILALFMVTLIVLALNPNLSSGHLSACLYSYQMMKTLTPERFNYDPFIEFLVALSNLQIHAAGGMCFASGLNNADKLIIMAGVTAVEILILLFLTKCRRVTRSWEKLVIWICRKFRDSERCPQACKNFANGCLESFNERVQKGFAYAYCTIAVLCYVNIADVSFQLLNPAFVGRGAVLYVDGNMKFFVNDRHIVYGCIALLLQAIVWGFPVILTFYSGPNPHMETLRAAFKPKRGFFLSYYLFCRVFLLLISTYTPAGPSKSALLQSFCIVFVLVIAVVRPYRDDQGGDESNEAQRLTIQAGNHAAETHRATGGGRSDEDHAQGVANQGGNGAEEAQRWENQDGNDAAEPRNVANQAALGNGSQNKSVAGTQTAVQNRWINESDVVILTAMSGIAILSSPISGDLYRSTRFALTVFVEILAYVPLVMAGLPYGYRLLYFGKCCKKRNNHVPQPGGKVNEEEIHFTEESRLLNRVEQQGEPDEPPGSADIPNYESTYHTAPQRHSARNDRYYTAQDSVIV